LLILDLIGIFSCWVKVRGGEGGDNSHLFCGNGSGTIFETWAGGTGEQSSGGLEGNCWLYRIRNDWPRRSVWMATVGPLSVQ
jgi:hypothetical protein